MPPADDPSDYWRAGKNLRAWLSVTLSAPPLTWRLKVQFHSESDFDNFCEVLELLGRALLELAEQEEKRSNYESQCLYERDGVTTRNAKDRPEKQDRPADAPK